MTHAIMTDVHKPVMPSEVLGYVAPRRGDVIVDATLGTGGHAWEIAARLGGEGVLIGLDIDPEMVELARRNLSGFGDVTRLYCASYTEIRQVLEDAGVEAADGLVADLGFCSVQMEDPGRGFSFSKDGPLDMRMGRSHGVTAADIVNRFSAADLATLFREAGQERFASRIASEIVRVRRTSPIRRTSELARLIERVVRGPRRKTHPATRVFQALRIAVNGELENLETLLGELPGILAPGGRAVILTFHSLEDKCVKRSFKELAGQGGFEILTKHVVKPSDEEIAANRRARSAKLRAIRKVLPDVA